MMTIKEIVITLIGGKIIEKIIEDNLPDFHYKKVAKAAATAARCCYMAGWLLLVLLGIKKLSQKEQMAILIIALIAVAIKWIEQQTKNRPAIKTVIP